MSFGLEVYSAAGKKTFTTESPGYLVIGVVSLAVAAYFASPYSTTYTFPEATGFTVSAIVLNGGTYTIDITYPSGVPTVTLTLVTGSGLDFFTSVIVYISAFPTASGMGLWSYDLNGNPAVINSDLPAYVYEGEVTLSASGLTMLSDSTGDCGVLNSASVGTAPGLWHTHMTPEYSTDDRLFVFDVPNTSTAQYGVASSIMSRAGSTYDGTYYPPLQQGRVVAYGVTPIARSFRKLGTWSTEVDGWGMKLFKADGARAFSTSAAPLRLLAYVELTKNTFTWGGAAAVRIGDAGVADYTHPSALPDDVCFIGNHYTGYIGGECWIGGKFQTSYDMASASLGWQKYSSTVLRAVAVPSLASGDENSVWWETTAWPSTFGMKALFIDRSLYV